jgi:hypothetical protein
MPEYLWMFTQLSGETRILEGNTLGGSLFICVKNYIACVELWADEDTVRAVEEKGRGAKFTWEIKDIHRAPNEGKRVIERLVTQIDFL